MSTPVRKNLNLATVEDLQVVIGKRWLAFLPRSGQRVHRYHARSMYENEKRRSCYCHTEKPLRYWTIPKGLSKEVGFRIWKATVSATVETLSNIGPTSIERLQKHFYIGCAEHDDCRESEALSIACLEQSEKKPAVRRKKPAA